MYHSITIGNKNTWSDWHLIPVTRPYVELPVVNQKVVEIPGRNGVLDLTTFLTGSPTYSNRKGSWEFYITNEYYLYSDPKFVRNPRNWSGWEEAYRTIAAHCTGRILSAVLEDDPNYSYTGRFQVSYKPGKDYSTITISYDLEPYKTNLTNGSTSFD